MIILTWLHDFFTPQGNVPPYPSGQPDVPPSYPSEKKLPPYPGGPFNNHNAAPSPPGMTIDNVGFL